MTTQRVIIYFKGTTNIVRARFAAVVPDTSIDVEICERIFQAANRIDYVGDDLLRLDTDWERVIRHNLELIGGPSMSTGDEIHFYGTDSHGERTWQCMPIGWQQVSGELP